MTIAPTKPNKPLARAVVTVVTQRPELHNQITYTCGTKACLAGWTRSLFLGMLPGSILDSEGFDWVDLDKNAVSYMSPTQKRNYARFCTAQFEWPLEAALLGVDDDEGLTKVFSKGDEGDAIEQFKILCGIAEDSA